MRAFHVGKLSLYSTMKRRWHVRDCHFADCLFDTTYLFSVAKDYLLFNNRRNIIASILLATLLFYRSLAWVEFEKKNTHTETCRKCFQNQKWCKRRRICAKERAISSRFKISICSSFTVTNNIQFNNEINSKSPSYKTDLKRRCREVANWSEIIHPTGSKIFTAAQRRNYSNWISSSCSRNDW